MYRISPKNPSHSLKIRICNRAFELYNPYKTNATQETVSEPDGTYSVCDHLGILRYRGREALEKSTIGPKRAPPFVVPMKEEKRRAMHARKNPLLPYVAAADDKELAGSPYWGGSYTSVFGISPDRINEYYELVERLCEKRTGGFGYGVQNCGTGKVSTIF